MPGLSSLLSMPLLGSIIIIVAVLLLVFAVIIPLFMKIRRKRIKSKETKEIMKDLFTWRHLAQLVKGGKDHNKAKQELSDNIIRINELFRQGYSYSERNIQNPGEMLKYVILGEPRSGKSSLLAASEMELVPTVQEDNPQEDPRQSLPVRIWTSAKSIVYDISGKVFFDRWLEESGAEWNYIVRQICKRRRYQVLDGIIITIPADALLADDEALTSRKAILMAAELAKLLRQSGMYLPCYVTVTKLDMVCGFKEYVRTFSGDQRHQILGFESDSNLFKKDAFERFWEFLIERLRSGTKQLLFPLPAGLEGNATRMDFAGKVWLFPDNFSALYKNLQIYLDVLFGEDNFHGTKNAFFEGVYFTSSRDLGFSFSPDIAALAGRDTDGVYIPVTNITKSDAFPEVIMLEEAGSSTALVPVNATKALISPYLQKAMHLRGYFIRELLHKRIFMPSPHAEYVRAEVIRRNIPQYAFCALMILIGCIWLHGAIFRPVHLRQSLRHVESYYEWLGGILQRGSHLRSPLVQKEAHGGFSINNEPLDSEMLTSRLQFYYDALNYRDMKISVPLSFRFSQLLSFSFDKNMGFRDKAFIANQIHKSMARIPVIKNTGAKLIDNVDSQVVDTQTRNVIASFVSLDSVRTTDFYRFFANPDFKLDSMIRYLMPDLSDDTMALLGNYQSRYDNAFTLQMDVDYIYSAGYKQAKDAALETLLSAWRRKAVYPDSIYGKLRTLTSISEDIAANYDDILAALSRINGVSSLGLESAVNEWKQLTDRHKELASRGRAVFEEIRLLLHEANIPLAFEASLPKVNVSSSGSIPSISVRRQLPDAFGDNLINDYLFNDMVISYAVRDFTRLFERDMEFLKKEAGDSSHTLGAVLAEQNNFSSSLNQEIENLRIRARLLQSNEFLSGKTGDKHDDPSLFTVAERIIVLASDITIPQRITMQNIGFRQDWEQGQSIIKNALDAFEAYVKPYAENEKLVSLISNARVMLLAEAFYNRYTLFNASHSFLNTFEGNISTVVELESRDNQLFAFSGNAIERLFGDFYYNRGYDPSMVKILADDVLSFISLLNSGQDEQNAPLFLRNLDRTIYQPPAFMNYLANYFAYWENYPERIYASAGNWNAFKARSERYRSFQINSVLLSVYSTSLDAVNQIDNSLLNENVLAIKNRAAAALGDRLALLNQFLSIDAERMFSAWSSLPADPLAAYNILRSLSAEDLRYSYLAVYTPPAAEASPEQPKLLSLGWWNSFVLDGLNILARESDNRNMSRLIENMGQYRLWPLAKDSSRDISMEAMRELASLLEAMGAGLGGDADPDPAVRALRHNLFQGTQARSWAESIYKISSSVADTQKPLSWTIYQAPTVTQQRFLNIAGRSRILAINRFRYVEISSANSNPRMTGTYMNQKTLLFQGTASDGGLSLKFYVTSQDRNPSAVIEFKRPWSIFEIYLQGGAVTDDEGNMYIPLYFEDAQDRYVYYVCVEFNSEIPEPVYWYNSETWPDLIISANNITARLPAYANGADP